MRRESAARYRQWMTHKLASWIDQFGELGVRRLWPLHHLVPGRHRYHGRGDGDPMPDQRQGLAASTAPARR